MSIAVAKDVFHVQKVFSGMKTFLGTFTNRTATFLSSGAVLYRSVEKVPSSRHVISQPGVVTSG
jgi:hypothetical protein